MKSTMRSAKKSSPKCQILRLNLAGYQNPSFLKLEKRFLEEKLPVKVLLAPTQVKPGPLVLITNTHSQLEEFSPKLLAQTELVIHPNSGFDNFKASVVKKLSFPIILGNPIRAQAVSEYILSVLFHHFTPLPQHASWQRQFSRNLLHQQSFLILGHGHVGKMVEKSLQALGLSVQVYDPFTMKKKLPKKPVSVLIIAASLNKTSKNMINRTFLEKYLVPDFLLINPARGEIIKESDLLKHLNTHPKSYAYLDVFCQEPNDFEKFQGENLNRTSHIAGLFNDLDQRILDFEQRVLYDFIYKKKTFLKTYKEQLLKNKLKMLL